MKAYRDLLNLQRNQRSENPFRATDPVDPAASVEEPVVPAASFGPCELKSDEINVIKAEKLGGGNYGNVFVGYCREQVVAVKILNNDLSAAVVEAFKKEAQFLSQLFHPNICLFMGACFERGKMMLVSELMENGTLQQLLDSQEEVSSFTWMRMMRDVARGMCWLHARPSPILHRDLKPANCLINRNFMVKICDFGFSEILPPSLVMRDGGKGQTGKGSPLWMAPEVLDKKEFSTSADVYSYSVMLWQTQARARPWDRIHDLDKLKQQVCVLHKRPTIPETTSAELRALIEHAWAPLATERPSFREIVSRLENIMIDSAISDTNAREFWKTNFLGKEYVPVQQFTRKMDDFLNLRLSNDFSTDQDLRVLRDSCLKAVLGESQNFVGIEAFGTVLKYIPFEGDFSGRVLSLLSKPWFHGSISTFQAEDSVRGRTVGSFLVRFSNSRPGCFTITRLEESGPVHQRIDFVQGRGLTLSGFEMHYETLEDLLQSEGARLGCIHSAPGSPYAHLFATDARKAKYKYEFKE